MSDTLLRTSMPAGRTVAFPSGPPLYIELLLIERGTGYFYRITMARGEDVWHSPEVAVQATDWAPAAQEAVDAANAFTKSLELS